MKTTGGASSTLPQKKYAPHSSKFRFLRLMTDSYRHKGLRKRMIETLRSRGITDEAVLAAMSAVPRHFFLDKAFEEHAYDDKPFPIGYEQTISQPFTVAYQTALLDIQKGDRVLEIGTGSGYQAAILAVLGARVYTIERQEVLFEKTKNLLQQLGFSSILTFFGDGTQGLPRFAPFDKIIVTAGAPVIPEALRLQLSTQSGILVIPVGEKLQYMQKIIRTDVSTFQEFTMDAFRFVPLLEGVVKSGAKKKV
jgi:protein-L-isoaspartate(D-aspartate) O-methyltransferase